MRAVLDLILFTSILTIALHLSNLAEKFEREAELNKRGIKGSLDRVLCVKGSPELQGLVINLYMYENRISIGETMFVPLEKLKIVETYKINEVRLNRSPSGTMPVTKSRWSKKIYLAYFLSRFWTSNYLSIKYTDQQGSLRDDLFQVHRRSEASLFAAKANHLIYSKGEKVLC